MKTFIKINRVKKTDCLKRTVLSNWTYLLTRVNIKLNLIYQIYFVNFSNILIVILPFGILLDRFLYNIWLLDFSQFKKWTILKICSSVILLIYSTNPTLLLASMAYGHDPRSEILCHLSTIDIFLRTNVWLKVTPTSTFLSLFGNIVFLFFLQQCRYYVTI